MRSSYLVRGVIDGGVFWVTQNFKKRNSALKEVKMIFKQVDSSAEHFFPHSFAPDTGWHGGC